MSTRKAKKLKKKAVEGMTTSILYFIFYILVMPNIWWVVMSVIFFSNKYSSPVFHTIYLFISFNIRNISLTVSSLPAFVYTHTYQPFLHLFNFFYFIVLMWAMRQCVNGKSPKRLPLHLKFNIFFMQMSKFKWSYEYSDE